VRADTLPLVLPVLGTDGLPRGAQVRIRLGAIDDITLEVSGTVIERLDRPEADNAGDASEDEDDDSLASPLALAIDLGENGESGESSENRAALPAPAAEPPAAGG
jgi:exoribonuclease-2